jgi:acetolactate synthase-1/2/3 large subunit
MKYSDLLAQWLLEAGYTHLFFVAGGNIMHLLESCSRRLTAIPVVHEVAAGIAAEYFNEIHSSAKALALVTAGPGLTNIVTAFGGAFLESRELLVIGGQVKVPDLAHGMLRQRGIQEIDGAGVVRPISVRSTTLEDVVDRAGFLDLISQPAGGRKGPVFLEVPLDLQARNVDVNAMNTTPVQSSQEPASPSLAPEIARRLRLAQRPVILLGGGVDYRTAVQVRDPLGKLGIPVMTTWNGADRFPSTDPLYFGRPNTWGQRYANILLQQADVVAVFGSRLGLQQTGFNWQEFVPCGEVIQVDVDAAELSKGHPRVALPICADANHLLIELAKLDAGRHHEWVEFCGEVKKAVPLVEPGINYTGDGFLSPYVFVEALSELCLDPDVVIPCSSGSAFTVMMQTFANKSGQRMTSNHGLASMGYGLSAAIGAAFAAEGRRTILVEGDGGFTQNLQELGTVAVNRLNMKIFLFDDDGYASIRLTQSNYFGGRYVGCDTATGLGMPKWPLLFAAYGIPMRQIGPGFQADQTFLDEFNAPGPAAFLVKVDPKQTYFPKISSRVTETGGMASNPIHLMTPPLDEALARKVFRYIKV